jgi:hypothetical protein
MIKALRELLGNMEQEELDVAQHAQHAAHHLALADVFPPGDLLDKFIQLRRRARPCAHPKP